jgi:NADPH-dependent 2,4-dienoyl-CoA reductase/sulfur reductase-like enzyme
MMSYEYLIIGGGVAGHRAAEEIRKGAPTATIAIISDESHRLYSRVMLPHVLHGKIPREKVFLVKPEWYAEKSIVHITNVSAEKIDASEKTVTLSDGKSLTYNKLLLATGGKARTFDVSGTPFLTFRGLDDTDRIAEVLKVIDALPREDRRVGIYGAGFIATEFIDLFAAHECEMHVFFRGPRFWGRQLDEKSSAKLEQTLKDAGAALHPNATFPDLLTWAPQFRAVGVGIGIESSFAFLDGTKVEHAGGIRCNEFLETAEKDIFTAGDVAEYDDATTKRPKLVGTWLNAEMQGRLAGKNMLGVTREPFKLVSSYATKLLSVSVTMIGEVFPLTAERVEVNEVDGGIIQRLYRGGKLVGATMVGTAAGRMEIQKEISG